MAVKYTNNAKSTLASGINSSVTSATVADGSIFPALGAGEYFYITFDDGSNNEIAKVTARSGNTLTIVRAQDNTTARAFSTGDSAELRIIAAVLTEIQENIAAKSANQTVYSATAASNATAYNIGVDPGVEANASVFLDGVYQHHDTFSFSGSTLTFDAAPTNGTKIEVVVDNLINLQSSNLTVDTFTATSGQTAFTLSDAPGGEANVLAFIDGVFQNQAAFTLSSNTLTFDTGVVVGRSVTVYIINPVNIGTPSDSTVTSAKLTGNITLPGSLTVGAYDVAFDSPTFFVDHTNSRVGLGTSSPSVPVDIVGETKMSSHLNLPDNAKIKVGTGGDLEIYSDGTHSYIEEKNASGNFYIKAESFNVGRQANSELYMTASPNGAVSLYHDNAVKLATTSTGVNVTGTLAATTLTGTLSTAAQTNITSLGTLTALTGGTGDLVWDTTTLVVDSSANRVGIGTTAPSTLLHLGGTAPGDSIIRQDSTSSGTNWEIGERAAGKWQIFEDDNDSIVATFMSTGNVGIGTQSPLAKLTVQGSSASTYTGNGPTPTIRASQSTDGNWIASDVDGKFAYFGVDGNDGKFAAYNYATSTEMGMVLGQNRVRIDNTGRVGINRTPAIANSKLEISGADDVRLLVVEASGHTGGIGIKGGTGSDKGLKLFSGGQIKIQLSDQTNVAYTADGLFHANSRPSKYMCTGAGVMVLGYRDHGSGLYQGAMGLSYDNIDGLGNTAYRDAFVLKETSNGGQEHYRVSGNGNVTNTNNSYGQISDERLKTNIVDASSQWDDIKAVKVRKFKFGTAPEGHDFLQIGVISQELESSGMGGLIEESDPDDAQLAFNPELVGERVKTVKYSVLYMKAIKALQEAMTRIETLEAKVSELES